MFDNEVHEISKAEAIQAFRKKCNWEIKERFRFLSDIEPILRTWNDELPNLRDLFPKEEIERLLVDSIYFLEVMIDDNPGEIFLDFVLRTGYKDEPDIGEDGKPLLHRSTPIHWAAKLGHENAAEDLFNIYDKFEANYIDEESNLTHFHAACMTGCEEIVKKFLEHGQDPNLPVENGRRAAALGTALRLDGRGRISAEQWRRSKFGQRERIDSSALASGALACVECLEKRGYQLKRSDALTIMNVFAKQKVFEKPTDLDESWRDDERFARRAGKIEIRENLTLYDFIRLRPERKEKLLTFMEYFELAREDYARRIPLKHREACTAHLCEILSKRFFRRWALDPFIELMRHRLPILCCAMIIQLLMNEDLRLVCLTSAGLSSFFLSA
ncbi:unnamed protein product [Trichogramma brassicae]|uniref:Uncharacterized protein n=1 Tax=Trichogramma brassicae TaxID=86971 RepID=A0A6H5IZ47_9HYME|nr:unnamed protein product [Trichogramma brassicae]